MLAESSRPLGLQRMFAQAVRQVDGTGARPLFDTPTASSRPVDDGGSSGAWPTPFESDSGHHFDTGTNTITFGQPTIQREATEAPPADAPPVAAEPAATVSAAPASAAMPTGLPTDVEELVSKLYDPLAARLRAELWMDRERAGALMDIGR